MKLARVQKVKVLGSQMLLLDYCMFPNWLSLGSDHASASMRTVRKVLTHFTVIIVQDARRGLREPTRF